MVIEFYYFFTYDYIVVAPDRISLLDEKQKMVTISPKELKALTEQLIKHAKKMRGQPEDKPVEK
jgi:hypothetical protein